MDILYSLIQKWLYTHICIVYVYTHVYVCEYAYTYTIKAFTAV